MNIKFSGSDLSLQSFKTLLMGKAKVTAQDIDTDAAIYEVSSLDTLYKLPKTFKNPSYFYITTQDPAVTGRIKEYAINGIFFPPVKADAVLSKIERTGARSAPQRGPDEYETTRIKVLAKAENIPPLPALAQQLIYLTKSDSSTISEITSKIKMDQGISSRVIKLINSPFYGVRQEISSIDRATVLLGFNSVKNIALAISIDQYFQKPFNMYGTTGKALWRHSYKTACIASELAKRAGLDPDTLYMAGLLHDVGKVVMADFLVKEVRYIEDEQAQLGFDHAEMGAVILNKWSVALAIAEAVKTHHIFSAPLFGKILFYANKIDNEFDKVSEIIDELAVILDIKETNRLKEKIIGFVDEFDAEI